jgi:AraC-like DNA-binding protein
MTSLPPIDRKDMVRIVWRTIEATHGVMAWDIANLRVLLEVVAAASQGGTGVSLAATLGLSNTTLHRRMCASPAGDSPRRVLDSFRLVYALYLHAHGFRVGDISLLLGFRNSQGLQSITRRIRGQDFPAFAATAQWDQWLAKVIASLDPTSRRWWKPLYNETLAETAS